jgi:hypothetical protein
VSNQALKVESVFESNPSPLLVVEVSLWVQPGVSILAESVFVNGSRAYFDEVKCKQPKLGATVVPWPKDGTGKRKKERWKVPERRQ